MAEAKPLVLQAGDGSYAGAPAPVSIQIAATGIVATDLDAGLDELAANKTTAGTTIKSSGTATLVGGTVTVATAGALTASRIFVQQQALGTVTAAKALAVTARSNGVSFTITSADATDTSSVAWMILNS